MGQLPCCFRKTLGAGHAFFAIQNDENAGATWVDQGVVGGNVITSRVPSDLPPFLPAIITALTGG